MDTDQKNDGRPNRHCALCLKDLSPALVKLCGSCNRRAYCSRECQVADWSPKSPSNKQGQGHKNWCKLGCGEEDLDWVVSNVAGKGLGLIAKRKIPAKFRIIVDSIRAHTHPGIKDLMPVNGTVQQKLTINGLAKGEVNDETIFCLRIARANHDCDSNANHYYDETFSVKILFAERDIETGEEICINYQPFTDISTDQSAATVRAILHLQWGITCTDDCFCQNKEIEEMVGKCRQLDREILGIASQGNATAALKKVEQLLQDQTLIHSSLISQMRTFHDGFQIAIMQKKTLNKAHGFIRNAHDILSSIISPVSSKSLEYGEFIKNPRLHRNYLILR